MPLLSFMVRIPLGKQACPRACLRPNSPTTCADDALKDPQAAGALTLFRRMREACPPCSTACQPHPAPSLQKTCAPAEGGHAHGGRTGRFTPPASAFGHLVMTGACKQVPFST